MKFPMLSIWVIGAVVGVGVLAWGITARANYESAAYEVVESDGDIEIREYPDLIVASTEAKLGARGNDGSFMRLFRYISGENESGQKIAMTTPVFMEEGAPNQNGTMEFVMPQKVAAAGAPAPNAAEVKVRTRQGGRFAVIRFPGVMNTKLAEAQEAKLRAWMKANGVRGEETAQRAGYDPPFKPGPLRRNEVLIRLLPKDEAKADPADD